MQIVAETLDGRMIRMSIPATKLHGDASELARVFADAGVRVVPRQEKLLMTYLDAARDLARMREWMTAQTRLGWTDGDEMTFVFPEMVCGAGDGVFQPERANRMSEICTVNGSLVDWQLNVAKWMYESNIGLFAICASFASSIVRSSGSDTFGFNLAGLTSRGKTTALQCASSVWGRGTDPGSDACSFCRRWTTTANALEATAEEHSDMLLPLDEIGSFRHSDELGRSVYILAGGRGAERLNASGQRRAVREWRTVILSSGEISIAELMRQHKQHQRGGQALRMLDIPLSPEGLFPGSALAAATVRNLKQAASKFYGSAGRAFVEQLIARFKTHSIAREHIRASSQRFVEGISGDIAPEVVRAAERFGTVYAAGQLAQEAESSNVRLDRSMTLLRLLGRFGATRCLT